MGARLRVFLTKEQDVELFNLRTAQVPQKVKDRAEVIRLNAQGWYVEKIAAHFHWGEKTVRLVLHKWNKEGIQEQTHRRGRRISILGLFQQLISFIYGLVIGGVGVRVAMEQKTGIRKKSWKINYSTMYIHDKITLVCITCGYGSIFRD